MSMAIGGERTLLRGKGQDLGRHALRFPYEDRTMLDVLAAQARERPDDAWAIFDGIDQLTFADAHRRVNAFADLVAERMPDGGQVALFLRNQIEFFPAFYGAMAAGCVTVPLNADSRGPLLEYAIRKSEAKVIVARADHLDRLAGLDSLGDVELVIACGVDGETPETLHGAPVISWEAALDGRSTEPPEHRPRAWDTCLIQFTSGTTGNSKGVVYTHHYLYMCAAGVADSQELTPDEVVSTPLPVFHVAGLHMAANAAMHAGCRIHLKSRFSARAFWQQIADDQATFALILGAMAEILVKTVDEAPEHRLERIFCVPFPPSGEEFERRFRTVINNQGYGMTEVYPTPVPRRKRTDVPRDTTGPVVTWMEYGIVDEHDRMLGPGEIGEMVFRPLLPHGMAEGYFKDPQATAEAFRQFTFHTGDLGYYDEEGLLHYRGRRQDRIRRRGENVSAAELEAVALSHDQVLEAAAYGVPGELGEHEIKVDVVCMGELDMAEFHAWLVERLPRYMFPKYLERHEAFPKTPSERVKKYQLAESPLDRPEVHVFEPVRAPS